MQDVDDKVNAIFFRLTGVPLDSLHSFYLRLFIYKERTDEQMLDFVDWAAEQYEDQDLAEVGLIAVWRFLQKTKNDWVTKSRLFDDNAEYGVMDEVMIRAIFGETEPD